MQLLTFPQLSAMEYVRVTVRGHNPVVVWLTKVKLPATSPQLSDVAPPAVVNWARVVYAIGRLPKHSTVVPAGQLIVGAILSLTVKA